MNRPVRVIVGISGASGAAIGLRVLERLSEVRQIETHLVISAAAERTLAAEIGPDAPARARALASHCHDHSDIGASIASGSFRTAGMIVAPCSMRSLSAVAYGQLGDLLARAADVQLKERRRLVLLVRESPLHFGHLRAMPSIAGRERSNTATTVPDIDAGSRPRITVCKVWMGLISSPCTPLISPTRLPGAEPLATITDTYQYWPVGICTPWK